MQRGPLQWDPLKVNYPLSYAIGLNTDQILPLLGTLHRMVQLSYLYRQVLYLVISNLSVVVVTQTVPWLFIVEPTEPPITALTCVIFIKEIVKV